MSASIHLTLFFLFSDKLTMIQADFRDIFHRFLDEATENESFGFNLTEPDHLLEDSLNNIPTLKVAIIMSIHALLDRPGFIFQYLVEGVLMFFFGCIGIIFNIVSAVFFVRQRSQRTFHR